MTQYSVEFNLFDASEPVFGPVGIPTGHANVALVRKDDDGTITRSDNYGINVSGGKFATWVNPFSNEKDGFIGLDQGWQGKGQASVELDVNEQTFNDLVAHINSFLPNTPINYNVLSSVLPKGFFDAQGSCYTFVQDIYERAGGSSDTFVDLFPQSELDKVDNWIEGWYRTVPDSLDSGMEAVSDFFDAVQAGLAEIADDVGSWLFGVRSGGVENPDLPDLPENGALGVTTGDPHLVTLDGIPYDFHAVGEYILLRSVESDTDNESGVSTEASSEDYVEIRNAFQGASLSIKSYLSSEEGLSATETYRNDLEGIANSIDNLLFDGGEGSPLINNLGGEAGFGENVLDRGDDNSSEEISITSIFENGLNFYGRVFDSLWVNNNGSVTFNGPRSTFTPEVISLNENNPEITPFFADVDTRGGPADATPGGNSTGSNRVYYDFDEVNDRFIVTWDDVGYFDSHTDKLNAFQLILTDRSDVGDPGDFDIEFRYENINWLTGDASGGLNGFGGSEAIAGWTASTGNSSESLELLDSTEDDSFEIQVRMASVGDGSASNNVAVATVTNGGVVMIDSSDEIPLSVDGAAAEIENFGSLNLGSDVLYREDNVYTLVYAGENGVIDDGDSRLTVQVYDDRIDVGVVLNDELAGSVEGLLADGDGNGNNDIALADGTVLDRPLEFSDVYGQYRDDWRVTSEEQSLFSYDEGESVEGFYNANHPENLLSIDNFTEEEIAIAEGLALNAGLVEGSTNFDNAVFDYLLTKDESFISSAFFIPTLLLANGAPSKIVGTSGDDVLTVNGIANTITSNTGSDVVQGVLADFFGDTFVDFSQNDSIIFLNEVISRSNFSISNGSAIIAIDTDNDGTAEGSFTLQIDFSGGDFMAVKSDGNTHVTFETFLPVLQERRAVDADLVNGIINQEFLTGDGTSDFQVTLRDMGSAVYDNVLGVYEIDASGNIIDTRILFENANADKSAVAGITDVGAGNNLGFFLVQDAADWAATLADSDTLSFVDSSGAMANISDGSDMSIAVNGAAVDNMVFHSFSQDLNSDGIQHALSGVNVGGEAITVGFEDLTGSGDRDYEDIVFRVEVLV
ncbi:MAG: nidogen-like domain-containing protein [Synechococcus sp.]